MKSNIVSVLATTVALSLFSPPASAEMDEKAIQVMGRVLGFVQDMPTGNLNVAVVYDPGNAASKAEADKLMGLMSSGYKVGKFVLSAELVPISDLSGVDGKKVAIVTEGMSMAYQQIFAATSKAGVLSVSTDKTCVVTGNCILGVSVQPKVEITLNAGAGDASGVGFSQALRMLVKEV